MVAGRRFRGAAKTRGRHSPRRSKVSVAVGGAGMSPSPPGRSAEGAKLNFGGLAIDRGRSVGDVGLPILAGHIAGDLHASGGGGKLGVSHLRQLALQSSTISYR